MSIDIEESVPVRINTGILDPDGEPIYYYEHREPIGFYRVKED